MSTVDELIQSLEHEGAEGGERSGGTFTLDRDKAREKMRLFQLPDPRAYVLELVQAAVLKGATKIRFDIDTDDMRMVFDGAPFTLDDFDGIWGSLLTSLDSPTSDARRQLALGLNAAMALNPRYINVTSGDGKQGAHLEMRPGEEDRFGPIDQPSLLGTKIHVKERFRPGLLVDFFRNIKGTLPEEQLLKERCRFSTSEIDLEGTLLSQGLALPGAIASVPFEADGIRGVAGLTSSPVAKTIGLTLVKDGVRIATHFLEGLMPGLVAVVEGRDLRKNVSQTDIVRDDAYRQVLLQVQTNTWNILKAYARLAKSGHRSAPLERTKDLLRWSLDRSVSIRTFQRLRSERDNDHIRFFCSIPLWTSIIGDAVTLDQLIDDYETNGNVVISSLGSRVSLETERTAAIVVENADEERLIKRLFEQAVEDWTEQIKVAQERERNRLAWQARRADPVLQRNRYLVRRPVRGDKINGEIGLKLLPTDRIRLRIIKNGCLLVDIKAPFDVLGLDVAIEAEFTACEGYDNVVADEIYGRAMDAVLDALLPLFDGAGRLKTERNIPTYSVRSFLGAITQLSARQKLLVQLGVHKKQAELLAKEHRGDWALKQLVFPTSGEPGPLPPFHGLRYARLIEIWNNSYISLDYIARELEVHGQLRVVDASVSPLSDPDALTDELWLEAEGIAQQREPDLPASLLRRRPIVRIDSLAKRLFGLLFDKTKFLDYRQGCFFLGRAEYFHRFKETKSPWITAKVVNKVQIYSVDMVGQLGLLDDAESSDNEGLITLFLNGRELGPAELCIPIEGLTAAVNYDNLNPNLEWDGVKEDAAMEAVREAAAGALVSLIEFVAGGPAITSSNWTLTAFLFDVATAVFPDLCIRRVYDARIKTEGAAAADLEHRAILELCASTSPKRVAGAVANRLPKTATPTAESVAQGLMGLGSKEPPEILPGSMAWLDALFPLPTDSDDAAPEFAERALSPVPALREARLFLRHNGQRVTLGQVIDAYRETGQVLFVREEARSFFTGDRLILCVTEWTAEAALMCIFGQSAVREAKAWLEEQKRQWHIEKRPQLDDLDLTPYEAIVAIPVDERGVVGQVGLNAGHPGTGDLKLKVRLCKDRREVGSTEENTPVELVALVNDNRIVMSDHWEELVDDPGKTDRNDLLLSKLPDLAEALCATWPTLKGERLETARRHVLDLLAMWWHLSERNLEKLQQPPWNGLLELPVFQAVDRSYQSVETLLRHRDLGDSVNYIPDESVRGEPLDEGTIVLALGSFESRRLKDLDFLPRSNYTKRWERERKVLVWRVTASRLPRVGELSAIHRHPFDLNNGLKGELLIPPTKLPVEAPKASPKVYFGAEGLLIEKRALSELFTFSGVVYGPRGTMTRDCETVTLLARTRENLEKAAINLYETLCDRFEANDFPTVESRSIARSYLAAAALNLINTRRNHTKRYYPLFQRLKLFPLLKLPGGKAISADLATKERPAALAGLGLWDSTESSPGQNPAPEPAPTPPPAIAQAKPASPKPIERKKKADVPKPQRQILAAEPPPSTPPEPTREDRLLEALRDTLTLIRDQNRTLLSDMNIDRIDITNWSDTRAVACDDWGTNFNRDHPMMKIIAERFEDDPFWLAFMASTTYTAINEFHLDPTDGDEERFHQLLIRLTATDEIYL